MVQEDHMVGSIVRTANINRINYKKNTYKYEINMEKNIETTVNIIKKLYDVHPINTLNKLTGFGIDLNPNKDYYRFIQSYYGEVIKMFKDLTKHNKKSLSFIDAGCGIPWIPTIAHLLGIKNPKGLEYNDMYCKIFPEYLIHGDITTYNFNNFNIIYAYNPIAKPPLMEKGLQNIINTMPKKGIFYYFNSDLSSKFLQAKGFKRMEEGAPLYKYIKK